MPPAPTCQDTARCREYFCAYLPTLLDQLLIPDLRSVNASCEIVVSDADLPPWYLTIRSGRLESVDTAGEDAACRFTLDAATLLDVVAGRLAPQEAFFDMRIHLDGDMETGLMLATVLEPFFKRFAWEG